MIRLTIPSIEDDDLTAVREALESGYLVQGPRVAEFETLVSQRVGTRYAVAVSNCTAALHLSLLALDVRPGDIVVVTAYSWIATANVIPLCGAQPVFVDIRPDTFNMDSEAFSTALKRLMSNRETAKRVKAVLPVHTFGLMADMTAITTLAESYGIPVIEDAACALGAAAHGRPAGSWGTLGCFSFHPRKAITTGEGGMIVGDDPHLIRRLKALRNHGLDPDAPSPDFIVPGLNCRLTEFQAALGMTQLRKLDSLIAARRRMAQYYDELLRGSGLVPQWVPEGHSPAYQSYVVILPSQEPAFRDAVIRRMRERGVETTIGTWNMPLTSFFKTRYGFSPEDFPVACRVFAQSLTLPLFAGLSAPEQEEVANKLKTILSETAGSP